MTPETFNLKPGQKALVTLDDWFYAPDAKMYRAAFGTIKGVMTAEACLGVKVNARSQDWFLEIGCITIAGCRIHYVLKTDTCSFEDGQNWSHDPQHGLKVYKHPCSIFDADRAEAGRG